MHELPVTEYRRVQPLAADQGHSLAVGAALAGCSAATIVVDDLPTPRAALLQIVHRLYLLGSAGDPTFAADLRGYLADVVVPARLAVDHHWLSVYDDAGGWHEALPELFPAAELHPVERIYLERPASPQIARAPLPPGYTLRAVDAALMAEPGLENHAALRDEMCSERVSVDDFLARSFGVCVVHGDEIAGWCLSEYNCGDRCEAGIETAEPHRRRGLATAMTNALCATADMRGITTVGWHCLAANTPSYATARRSGFVEVCRYRSHYVRIAG